MDRPVAYIHVQTGMAAEEQTLAVEIPTVVDGLLVQPLPAEQGEADRPSNGCWFAYAEYRLAVRP